MFHVVRTIRVVGHDAPSDHRTPQDGPGRVPDHARVRPGRVVPGGVQLVTCPEHHLADMAAWDDHRARHPSTGSWFKLDGVRHTYQVVDEIIVLDGYGSCRQVTLFEHGRAVAQILTSDLASTPGRLVHLLKCRWRIENAFKYLVEHHGIDWLCDYRKTLIVDERPVRNPDRTCAKAVLNNLKAELAATEQTLGKTLAGTAHTPAKLAELSRLRDHRAMILDEIVDAAAVIRTHRAKLKANDLDPTAVRALLVLRRRNMQMVLRLLAYNAELWLADRYNAYLADPDEYRAITRHLLHQPGIITYTPTQITVKIQTPDQPRIARALRLLATELNHTNTHIPGDNRPLNYQIGT